MTDLLVKSLQFLTDCVAKYMPTVGLGDGVLANVVNAVGYLVNLIASLNWILPVKDIMLIFSIYFAYRAAMFGFFVVNWVIRRILDIIPF